MNKVLLLLPVFLTSQLFAQEIEITSSVNISEFKGKYASGNEFCFLSSSDSNTSASRQNVESTEESGRIVQEFQRWGINFLTREINWDSQVDDNSFSINFFAGGSYFNAYREYDKGGCSYKVKKSETSHTSTKLKANATIKLKENVWLVRARFPKYQDKGRTDITLYNWDYAEVDGQTKLTKKPLRTFEGAPGEVYFLINPSTKEINNAIDIELSHTNNTTRADSFQLELFIDQIGQDECLANLSTRSFKDILKSAVDSNNEEEVENSMVVLGCMMTPHYIRHILKNMFFTSVEDFFNELDWLENYLLQSGKDENSIHYPIINDLLKKIRFYYSYEMAKDIMFMFQANSSDPSKLSNLQILEKLRWAGAKNLIQVSHTFSELLDNISANEGFFIELNKTERIHWLILERFLKDETNYIQQLNSALQRPALLSTQYYHDLEISSNELVKVTDEIKKISSEFNGQKVTRSYLLKFRRALTNYLNVVENYNLALENFSGNFFGGAAGEDIVKAHREFHLHFRTIFHQHTISLREYFKTHSEYFHKHFEAEEFKSLVINGEKFEDADAFILRFNQVMDGDL